jgi:hypothetical protein
MGSKNQVKRLRVYDQQTVDYDLINSIDEEVLEISSPPLKVYPFNLAKTVGPDQTSPLDDLYAEVAILDEKKIEQMYQHGGGGFTSKDFTIVRAGEIFDNPILVPGYYQEPTWTQELERMGVENVEEELAITFNYQTMLSLLGQKEIKMGDVIQTFRGKIYRVMDAYVADEIWGWKYLHFHVVARKPEGLDQLRLPEGAQAPPVGYTI